MNFYNVEIISTNQLNDIEESLLIWKLINIPTYIDMLEYHNNELITFSFEINYIKYNLNIIFKDDKWIVELNHDINYSNQIHLKILDMIRVINSVENNLRLPTLTLNTIELVVDQTEFNDDSDSETELSESETSSSDDYHFIPDPTEDSDTEYNFESEIINSYDANI